MIDDLVEFVVAGIILATGVGIALVIWGGDPEVATALIKGATQLGVFILVFGLLVAIPLSMLR